MSEAYEPQLLGSAGTVSANRDLADGAREVLIVYADNLSDVDLEAMLAFHRGHGDPLTMMLFRAPRPENCGIPTLDAQNRVVEFVEKPKHPKSDLANAGLYVLSADAYREVADQGAFDFGFDMLPRFVGRMRGWHWPGYHLDIGTHRGLGTSPGRRAIPATRQEIVMSRRPAVFLDRDGTVIEAIHYLRDPAAVRLLPGAGHALARLAGGGFRLRAGHQPVGNRTRTAHRRRTLPGPRRTLSPAQRA